MEELEEPIDAERLEDFKIPEIDPIKKRRRQRYLILLAASLLLIAIIIIIFVIINKLKKPKKYYNIKCKYTTNSANELVQLINWKAIENIEYELKINETKVDHNIQYKYKFEYPGEHQITFRFSKKLNSLGYFFYGIDKLTEIDLSDINANAYTNMTRLFYGCESLQMIIFGNDLKTVNYMDECFSGCNSLLELNLQSFNTEKVENMGRLFSGCHSLYSINLGHLNTNNVNNMEAMFSGCYSLQSINLTTFDFGKVEDMSYMFSNCQNLENLYFTNINTTNLKRMTGLFMECHYNI